MRYSKIILFAVITLAGLIALYLKCFSHINNKDIILSENQEEYKRKPLDPGGVIIPHSNSLIYEKLKPSNAMIGNVNFLSDPEEPIDLGFKSNLENVAVYDSIDDILAKLDLHQEDIIARNEPSNREEDSVSNTTDLVNSNSLHDEIHVSDTPITPSTDQIVSKLKITKLGAENNKLYGFNINSVESGYKIQLSSAWSEKEAKTEWQKIQVRHIKYLKNAQLIVKKVKVNNDRIIYLIMSGNYSSLNQAKLICKQLVSNKQNCIVTK